MEDARSRHIHYHHICPNLEKHQDWVVVLYQHKEQIHLLLKAGGSLKQESFLINKERIEPSLQQGYIAKRHEK